MADRFNSVAGGNWNSTSSWATTDGGAGPASFPVAGDRVFITGNGGTITVNVSSACGDFSKTGATLAGSAALSIGGSASFGGTITYTGTITYGATATGKTIAHNGKTLGSNIILSGVGGGWTQTDAANTSGTWTLTNGAYSDGGFNNTASTFSSNNANARSITKTALWTATGTGTCVNFSATLTLSDSGGWNLTNSGATARTFATAGMTFSDVAVSAGTMVQSFTGAGTVRNLNWTGFSGSWAAGQLSVSGDLTHSATMTVTAGAQVTTMTAAATGTATITSNGVQTRGITVDAPGGTVQQADALDLGTGRLTHNNGTFLTQSKALSFNNIASSGAGVRTMTPGSSLITVTGFVSGSNIAWGFGGSNLTFNAGTSTIKFTDASATQKLVNLAGFTYNNIWFAPGAGAGGFLIQGGATIGQLKDDGSAAHTLTFQQASTWSVADWQVSGNAGQLISLASSAPGSQFTLTKTGGGNVTADYLSASDMVGAGNGYCWFLGGHSVNAGNNLGVAFCTAANASMMAAAA